MNYIISIPVSNICLINIQMNAIANGYLGETIMWCDCEKLAGVLK